MAVMKSTLPEEALGVTGTALQNTLVDLLGLSLIGKEAHWNIVGPRFRSIHLQLDEVVATARAHSDTVAERAAALGVPPERPARDRRRDLRTARHQGRPAARHRGRGADGVGARSGRRPAP